ncbi:hypothetical protein FGG08_006605 [Glutinoglossum americanum]|uniref:Uncharacterized protein n=1 Tax=Glutinoglossum americanum TaxID=1670608 RepID=A0A9P8L071_9PEZI|nr:hypothetical protein FGG08_006605 [Glutinoglossum americanum]
MIISSRQPPSQYIRRSHTPLGISPAKHGFKRLFQEPPPSPRLPSLVNQRGQRPPTNRHWLSMRLLAWLCGVGLILWFAVSRLRLEHRPPPVSFMSHDGQEYEIVGDSALPDYPTPVVVTDRRGRLRWTISIPPARQFPLRPDEYSDICQQSEEIAHHVAELKYGAGKGHGHFDYYHLDKNFMDVREAEENGLLPGMAVMGKKQGKGIWGSIVGGEGLAGEDFDAKEAGMEMCEKSLTYVLETTDAGLGNTLLGLWMAYGLAKEEGRAFFIDDTNWVYGDYETFFQPPPIPSCLPPPRTQILPCPHHTAHLLVSAATTYWTFGHNFHEEFEDPRKMEVWRQHRIFGFMELGKNELFHLADQDEAYSEKRKKELRAKVGGDDGLIVGVHVRHGDRHPFEFQYQESYIPLDRYISAAESLTQSNTSHNGNHDHNNNNTLILLASDDPDVYSAPEMSPTTRAQSQIHLASKTSLEATTPLPPGARAPYIDNNIGWEGGFYHDLFWSLDKHNSANAGSIRALLARAYLLDLKVLGETSDRVVCGVSAVGCRLLAVIMGWEKAIKEGRWGSVDGDFEWMGILW